MNHDKTEGEDLDTTEAAPGLGDVASEPREIPTAIGKYRIVAKLGEGGMGVVYEAEQDSPKRKVAVKVVRGGQFVDEQHVRMFQREADTLARLKHPNIAAIYESGHTSEGQHFFAMELVRGETLDRYIKKSPIGSTREELRHRLQLFRKISDAVHYAHQRGVIHRDLKPSNIIVDTSTSPSPSCPEIKILDFGLARITEVDTAATLTLSRVGDIKGTLAYMSPEQARGEPGEIDVRTDVYALGMILYEMLSGARPYDVMQKALTEAVRVICEEQPKSLRQTLSGTRRIDPDIETIVGKALEKEPERRYASAAALSEDVGRYLTSQPILARPPSPIYQLRKFAARNQALVGGIATTLVALVAGIVVSTMFGLQEAAQRRDAELARDDLEIVVGFQAGMLDDLDPDQMGRRLMENLQKRVGDAASRRGASEAEIQSYLASFKESMLGVNTTDAALQVVDEDILGRAAKVIDTQFADRPVIDARLRQTIGETYRKLGLYEQSEPQLEVALSNRKRVLGDNHPDTLDSMYSLAILYRNQSRYEEAESLHLETLEARRRVLGEDHPDTLGSMNSLAILYGDQGRYDEAETLYLQALEVGRRVLGNSHPVTGDSISNLATLYFALGRYDEAEQLSLEALATSRRVLGEDHPDTLSSMDNLAVLYRNQDRFSEAESLYLETLEARRRVLGEDHPATLGSMNNLARLYVKQGRYDDAEPLYVSACESLRSVFGDGHIPTLVLMGNLGELYTSQGRYDEAATLLAAAVEGVRRALPRGHALTGATNRKYGVCLSALGRYHEAESYLLEAREILTVAVGADHPQTLRVIPNLVELYEAWSKPTKAAEWRGRLPETATE